MDKRKELKMQYKTRKRDMGIYIIRCLVNNKCFIDKTDDLVGTMNGSGFKLKMSGFPNRELAKAYKELGEENFVIEVLEKLPYDEDGTKTNYTEDLMLLFMIWEEKLNSEGKVFYKR